MRKFKLIKKSLLSFLLSINLVSTAYAYENPQTLPDINGMSLDQAFIAVAESQIGYEEDSNYESYFGAWAGDAKQAWCSEFVSWSAEQAGIPGAIIPKVRSSSGFREFFSKIDSFYLLDGGCLDEACGCSEKASGILSVNELKKGDILIVETNGDISNGPDHTCIFLSVEQDMLCTLDGNSGNMVKKKTREISSVHGVCRPDFSKTVIETEKEQYIVKKRKKVSINTYIVNTNGSEIIYKSKNKKIATVDKNGIIKGIKKGHTYITIQCNGISKKIYVTVS